MVLLSIIGSMDYLDEDDDNVTSLMTNDVYNNNDNSTYASLAHSNTTSAWAMWCVALAIVMMHCLFLYGECVENQKNQPVWSLLC